MIKTRSSILIECPVEHTFQYIVTSFFENYPKWSPEVVELEKITSGPVGKGTIARQVRVDGGYRTESVFQIVDYEPLRRVDFESTSSPRYRAVYDFKSVEAATLVQFTFELKLDLFLRPFETTISRSIKAGGEAVVQRLKRLLEAEDYSPSAINPMT